MENTCSYYKCDNSFPFKSNKKYCSRKCKERAKLARTPRLVRRFRNEIAVIPEYVKYKKSSCEKCGFVPFDKCQLDVDHIDGNHSNNAPNNLQTLCANCHRLKTNNKKMFNQIDYYLTVNF